MSLINYLPYFYDNPITKGIQDSMAVESNTLNDELENTLNQMFVDTATFGLGYWEKMLYIPKNNFDYQTRRENIKAKLRGRGTTTRQLIKSVCEAYSNASVDVIVNHLDYSFIIDFTGTIGIPTALDEMEKSIVEIKPCHLAHSYKFRYNTHNVLSKFTYAKLNKYTYESVRGEVLNA